MQDAILVAEGGALEELEHEAADDVRVERAAVAVQVLPRQLTVMKQRALTMYFLRSRSWAVSVLREGAAAP